MNPVYSFHIEEIDKLLSQLISFAITSATFAVYFANGLSFVALPHRYLAAPYALQMPRRIGRPWATATPHNDSGETRPQRANRFRLRCDATRCDDFVFTAIAIQNGVAVLSMTPCCQCDLLLPIARIKRSIMVLSVDVCQVTYVASPTERFNKM